MGSHIGVISAEHERGAKQKAAIEGQIEKSTRSPKIRSVSEAQRYIIILLFNESTIKLDFMLFIIISKIDEIKSRLNQNLQKIDSDLDCLQCIKKLKAAFIIIYLLFILLTSILLTSIFYFSG